MWKRLVIAAAFAAALVIGHGIAARASTAPAHPHALACSVRLGGAITGEYPCTATFEERRDGLAFALATPPEARAQVSLDVVLAERDGVLASARGAEPRVVVREPGHAGVGVAWTRAAEVHGAMRSAGAARDVDLRVDVGPCRANPDGRPVVVQASVVLPAASALAARGP